MPKSKTSIIPLADRVLVRPFSEEELSKKTKSGIIIPDTVDKERPEQGEVIAVGEGRMENGKRVPMTLKVGNRIVFSKYGFDEIKIDDKEFYVIKEENILAIIK
jgi:chaperonin GroES